MRLLKLKLNRESVIWLMKFFSPQKPKQLYRYKHTHLSHLIPTANYSRPMSHNYTTPHTSLQYELWMSSWNFLFSVTPHIHICIYIYICTYIHIYIYIYIIYIYMGKTASILLLINSGTIKNTYSQHLWTQVYLLCNTNSKIVVIAISSSKDLHGSCQRKYNIWSAYSTIKWNIILTTQDWPWEQPNG